MVTARQGKLVYGLTVSSFSSLSIDPVLILVCIANNNHMAKMVPDSRAFAVSILAEGQDQISKHFAVHGRDPAQAFEVCETEDFVTGSPVIAGSLGHLDCEMEASYPGGDHTIVVGRVVHAGYDAGRRPLIYFRRGYRTLLLE